MPPTIAKFLTGTAMIQRFIRLAVHSVIDGQSDRPLTLMPLPLMFSHTTLHPIARLSITHDEFLTDRQKAKSQAFVEVGRHVHQTLTGEQLP